MQAKGGGVSSLRVFTSIFARIDPSAASKFNGLWAHGSGKYRAVMKPKRDKLEKDLKNAKSADAKKKIKEIYNYDRGIESAMCVTNEAFGFLIQWLESNKGSGNNNEPLTIVAPADAFVQEIYRYVASMSPDSGKFIIMK